MRVSWVAVIGPTTGSHLGLPDGHEERLTIIWVAQVDEERLERGQVVEDRQERRNELGLMAPH